jgi:predicted ATPase/class 3 adenylate cyclase
MEAEIRTFLFTDIEGSTRSWEEDPAGMNSALEKHDSILRAAVSENDGTVFKHTGDGLAACFLSPMQAIRAAVGGQRALGSAEWPSAEPLRVRMGIGTGAATFRDGDFFGTPVNKTARLMGVGHGGQVLIASDTAGLLETTAEWGLRDLGVHRLRDLAQPVQVMQVLADGLVGEFPPLRTLDAYPSNLPRNLPVYVGRDDLITGLESDLKATPVITLAGTGGIGKTRLAQQLGAQVLPHYDDGVWFVDLAPLGTAEAVHSAVARTLGIPERATEPVLVTLVAGLRAKKTLLILDNCEQVSGIAASLVEEITAAAPGVRIIATSREPLGVYGEKVCRLDGLEEESAIALFVTRAAEAGRDVDSATERDVIVELNRRLDGLPLALELAAARTRSMAPAEVLDRLDERFGLLRGSGRRVERHRTLEAMVDWSYGLLDEDEALLLNRLSIFVGSFDLRSVEAVCADDRLDEVDIADLIDWLVAKSLVAADLSGGTTRYRLMETIHAYAARHLAETGEVDTLRDRHMRYFSQRGQALAAAFERVDLVAGAAALGFDIDNLNEAIDRLTEQGRHAEKAQIVTALGLYWTTGAPNAGRSRFEELVAVGDALEPDLRMAVLVAAASLFSDQAFAARALELLEMAKSVADEHGLAVQPYQYYVAANVAEIDGRTDDVLRLCRQGITLAEDDAFIEMALRSRMLTSLAKEDLDGALRHAEETLAAAQEMGFDLFVAAGQYMVGTVCFLQGNMANADVWFDDAIATAGDALPQVVIAAKVQSAVGHRSDDPERAKRLVRDALELEAQRDVMPAFRVIAGDLVASLWTDEGRFEDAATLLAAGQALRERLGFHGVWWARTLHDETWTRVTEELDTVAISRVASRARTMADAELRKLIRT